MLARLHFQKLVDKARLLPPLSAAVVFPCDLESLQVATSGAFAGYLQPTLVGPEARIRDVADKSGLDISRLQLVDTADDPRAAGLRAADAARDGRVSALVKGTLEQRRAARARRGARNRACAPSVASRTPISWIFPVSSAGLLLADAHMNVTPNLAAKRDIVQNTVAARDRARASPRRTWRCSPRWTRPRAGVSLDHRRGRR